MKFFGVRSIWRFLSVAKMLRVTYPFCIKKAPRPLHCNYRFNCDFFDEIGEFVTLFVTFIRQMLSQQLFD